MRKAEAVDLQIAISMTCHCAVCTTDHLSEVVAQGHGSTVEHIKLHRNKCTCLIKNIILPTLKTDIDDSEQEICHLYRWIY